MHTFGMLINFYVDVDNGLLYFTNFFTQWTGMLLLGINKNKLVIFMIMGACGVLGLAALENAHMMT